MRTPDRIVEIREANGYTRKRLAEELGRPYATITKYETGEREPGHAYIIEIAKKFNVSTDYILGLSDNATTKISLSLSNSEAEHIKKYRALDEHGKEVVSLVLDCEHKRWVNNSNSVNILADNIIPFRQSIQPVSAGSGAYLGPEEFETIFVEKNTLTSRASFGVRVSGNSMEPLYHDGDILIVEGAEDIDVGKIGVFTINGNGYVKKRGEDDLISLNPNYEPIPLTEDSCCNGRVIGVLDPAWIVK